MFFFVFGGFVSLRGFVVRGFLFLSSVALASCGVQCCGSCICVAVGAWSDFYDAQWGCIGLFQLIHFLSGTRVFAGGSGKWLARWLLWLLFVVVMFGWGLWFSRVSGVAAVGVVQRCVCWLALIDRDGLDRVVVVGFVLRFTLVPVAGLPGVLGWFLCFVVDVLLGERFSYLLFASDLWFWGRECFD